ncbi:hypothetical protein GCM10008927_06240 [Amylibacter ulvae]|uniref:Uncharacterized protein n=1 Tax=Paramylibacter ulvae TaxID=1651968 RepID=A0ABQ3CUR5_9RHOB|nr:hypothetical protein [Amylibacter ulvae]GHA44220.1 hypothetical protein GCM10008927_06240 [Amylibacter ulvae]
MTNLQSLYGTDIAPLKASKLKAGPISLTLENGILRHVKLNGSEIIRSIAFLVRDADWGTLAPDIDNLIIDERSDQLVISYSAQYQSGDALLNVDISIDASAGGLKMLANGVANGKFETNRAGFTVLHPIKDVAGCPVEIQHSDGSVEHGNFPALIEPWQPFVDINAITHQAGNHTIRCQLVGDTFEMEDQRQWGDASFKTYNRPLAQPWPYTIADGDSVEQSVSLTWAQKPAIVAPEFLERCIDANFPEMALVISPEDAVRLAANPNDLNVVQPQRLLCHLDTQLGDLRDQFNAFAHAQSCCPDVVYDLELIIANDDNLDQIATVMNSTGFSPDSVMICPSVDRQSTPPGSEWPDCPPLEIIHKAGESAFPNLKRGGGMVSFFPELNRKRPPIEMLDFVSHGLCPIVHAADDFSVMETLETIAHITTSARAIIGTLPYRIGPATIAMRQNPYGNRTIPNPNNDRVCMTDNDPRHRAKFGAAYVVGLATALAQSGISVWTPAYLYGPRGLIGSKGCWPIAEPLAALAKMAGQGVKKADISDGRALLSSRKMKIVANLTPLQNDGLAPFGVDISPVL